ncbi:SDR family oxidoreductase [Geodermatophilus sp. Leaf369]|uniref:SDR family oxidoreductase n=1 Tax=Geodermatophilus sp. Leaf369 TaxID=1736354 RepID=UPI000A401F85|nr:SDR family oxidoreductase [Geodermatophilus sp. Leaf369]
MSIEQNAPTPPFLGAHALVVGASGITGSALVEKLTAGGWEVSGLSRNPIEGSTARHVRADLRSAESLAAALGELRPTHVFFCAWSKQDTEAENIVVNKAMVADLLAALAPGRSVRHVALVTGLKHYLGPFEAYAQGEMPDTPFHEDAERLPVENFYYAQEDALFAAAAEQGFTWSVHRSHTVIGHAVGNAMNMGSTLAAYAAICRADGRPFVFPGSETQWNSLVDMTDAGLLADHMIWASTTEAAADEAFNVVNGDVFRWRWMWPKLATALDVEPVGFAEAPRPLEEQMADAEPVWARVVAEHGLVEPDLSRVASWWHTDSDLGRDIEVLADMSKSRLMGFTGYVRTEDSFYRLFDRYRADGVLP